MSQQQRFTIAEINDGLRASLEPLCRDLLPGGRREGAEGRAGGTHGGKGKSLGVRLHGAKAGVWQDFSTGQNGDPFELVTVCLGLDKSTALKWSLDWLGWEQTPGTPISAARPKAPHKNDKEAQRDIAQRQSQARTIWRNASPLVAGTVAASYLAWRGITLDNFPKSLRQSSALWHGPAKATAPAMIAAIQTPVIGNLDGNAPITGVHRTYLTQSGEKAAAKPNKMMAGTMKGGAIRLGPAAGRLYVAEGIETGLSVLLALGGPEKAAQDGCAVWIAGSVGNFKYLVLPGVVRELIICADSDGSDSAVRATLAGGDTHASAGLAVSIARPPVGLDFNDVLRGTGLGPRRT